MDGNGELMILERQVGDRPVRAEVRRLDEGVHVLLTGGDRTHVGAVSWAEPGAAAETVAFPGHRDQVISAPWAEALAAAVGQRTVVACGIHYDAASPERIREILAACAEMLEELKAALREGTAGGFSPFVDIFPGRG